MASGQSPIFFLLTLWTTLSPGYPPQTYLRASTPLATGKRCSILKSRAILLVGIYNHPSWTRDGLLRCPSPLLPPIPLQLVKIFSVMFAHVPLIKDMPYHLRYNTDITYRSLTIFRRSGQQGLMFRVGESSQAIPGCDTRDSGDTIANMHRFLFYDNGTTLRTSYPTAH